MIRRAQTPNPAMSPRKLAVITCHFNFARYKKPRSNCLRFLRSMDRQGIPVFGVELHLPDQEPLALGRKDWKVIEADPAKHVLWQKEALLNLALGMVPAEYNAIAWMDNDLDFSNPNWASQTEQALLNYDVVQPFHEAVWTREDGSLDRRRPAAAKTGLDQRWLGHPGFAWAARREVLERAGGLYPHCLLGNGDTLMALAFFGAPLWPLTEGALGNRHDKYYKWRSLVGQVTTSYVHGQVWHEWHGDRPGRRYSERVAEVQDHDLTSVASFDANGLICWNETASEELKHNMAAYFLGRREDG